MNIFVLDTDPRKAAQSACDKHIVKMPLETTQMLCTVSWRYGKEAPYRAAFRKHPCTLWAGRTQQNWLWLVEHGLSLCDEYSRRYGREHTCKPIIRWAKEHGGHALWGDLTPFAQAMPVEYQRPDPVAAYRAYYIGAKSRFATWKAPARKPDWL